MLKFIARNYVILLVIAAVVLLGSIDVLAGDEATKTAADSNILGPFRDFLRRGADLFYYTRNAIFVVAAFVFIKFAWGAIMEGKIEPKELLWMIIGLVLLGVAGFIVSWFGGADVSTDLQSGDTKVNSFDNTHWVSPKTAAEK